MHPFETQIVESDNAHIRHTNDMAVWMQLGLLHKIPGSPNEMLCVKFVAS